jgi:hypothetical protein
MSTHSAHPCNKSHLHTFVEDFFLLGPRMMGAALEQAIHLFRGHSHEHARHGDCCHIPETECPSRCACEIKWEGRVGQQQQSTIRVKNTSTSTRNFAFSATPFQGPGNPAVAVTLSPWNASLPPGQSTLVTASFTPTPAFQVGESYEAEMHITGAYEQCVCLHLTVLSAQHAHCEVEQADPPLRVRAHHWFDHFQCAEPCFPRRGPVPAPPHEG